MPIMYCPQCGRELDLDSGEVRFCRYCGLPLADTRDELRGYSAQKRTSFSIVTWSYALLLGVTLLLHGQYVSLNTRWGYWLPAILIVVSVSLFVSAAISALKPAMFSKTKRGPSAPGVDEANALAGDKAPGALSPGSPGFPAGVFSAPDRTTAEVKQPASVTEGTTKRFDN